MIHNPQHYVRDFYFFKRSQYPQLALVHKKPGANTIKRFFFDTDEEAR
jgi:hypothetical protein